MTRIRFTPDLDPDKGWTGQPQHWTAQGLAELVGQQPRLDGHPAEVVAAELVDGQVLLTVDLDERAPLLDLLRHFPGGVRICPQPVAPTASLPPGMDPSGDPLVDGVRRALAAFRSVGIPAELEHTPR